MDTVLVSVRLMRANETKGDDSSAMVVRLGGYRGSAHFSSVRLARAALLFPFFVCACLSLPRLCVFLSFAFLFLRISRSERDSYLITGGTDRCIRYWDFQAASRCYLVRLESLPTLNAASSFVVARPGDDSARSAPNFNQ